MNNKIAPRLDPNRIYLREEIVAIEIEEEIRNICYGSKWFVKKLEESNVMHYIPKSPYSFLIHLLLCSDFKQQDFCNVSLAEQNAMEIKLKEKDNGGFYIEIKSLYKRAFISVSTW
jgi:hypothetical protein